MLDNIFRPKLFSLIKEGRLTRNQLVKDSLAGLIVGIIALPLAIAFAIASGVSPEKGLITAVVAGLTISIFGGSRVQIGGPTGAFIVIVYGVIQQHGFEGLVIATLMAGFIMIIMGVLRFGNLLRFVPYPLIIGFTSGIAVIIFSTQIQDFFGLPGGGGSGFLESWMTNLSQMGGMNGYAVTIAFLTMLISLNFHRVTRKVPGSLVAIILSTLIVALFDLPVSTIESRFGEIPSFSLPSMPRFSFETFTTLIPSAFAIAFLGAIESLLSAVVADGMIGGKHRPNTELIAQGGANILSSLFGGIPATGAIARTATNVKNGGRTPVAGIVHALFLFFSLLLFAPYVKLIPMATLAGILVVVAYHMSEWREFRTLLKGSGPDVLVLLVTFFLTIIYNLVVAIQAGIILSAFLLMKRMSDAVRVQYTPLIGPDQEKLFEEEPMQPLPKGVAMFEVSGALFFGAALHFQNTLTDISELPRVMVLRMTNVPFIDATGVFRLKETVQTLKKKNTETVLAGVQEQAMQDLISGSITDVLEKENIHNELEEGLKRARELAEQKN